MLDVIELLSDSLANKIAAGEVVQRPASAVKELLENAVDAKATQIKLVLKDGGSTLIQVADNGVGMSITDARMCWERHATSKIKKVDDLFNIRSFGFRGEALASIAAVAQVEMKTKRKEDEMGTRIVIAGSKLKTQEPAECRNGTQISIKNLFYNLPARRSFLKSNAVETRHCVDQFIRVAMAQPQTEFTLINNEREVFKLLPTNAKERFSALMGYKSDVRLLSVSEVTSFVEITGWISEPSQCKKTRGEQFFLVNNRFVKDNYLNHAVFSAYEGLIEKDKFPSFMLSLSMDPKHVDINVHPTKTEVKFVDERGLYAIVKSVVRKALSDLLKHISPSEDYIAMSKSFGSPKMGMSEISQSKMKADFNPFGTQKTYSPKIHPDWQKFYETEKTEQIEPQQSISFVKDKQEVKVDSCFLVSKEFIAVKVEGVFYLVHQKRAQLRILYERNLKALKSNQIASQQLLFPRTIMLGPNDFNLFIELQEDIQKLGCDMHAYGNNKVIVNGLPPNMLSNEKELLEGVLEAYKNSKQQENFSHIEKLAYSLATCSGTSSLNSGEEIESFIKELWATEIPFSTPHNKIILKQFDGEELHNLFT